MITLNIIEFTPGMYGDGFRQGRLQIDEDHNVLPGRVRGEICIQDNVRKVVHSFVDGVYQGEEVISEEIIKASKDKTGKAPKANRSPQARKTKT